MEIRRMETMLTRLLRGQQHHLMSWCVWLCSTDFILNNVKISIILQWCSRSLEILRTVSSHNAKRCYLHESRATTELEMLLLKLGRWLQHIGLWLVSDFAEQRMQTIRGMTHSGETVVRWFRWFRSTNKDESSSSIEEIVEISSLLRTNCCSLWQNKFRCQSVQSLWKSSKKHLFTQAKVNIPNKDITTTQEFQYFVLLWIAMVVVSYNFQFSTAISNQTDQLNFRWLLTCLANEAGTEEPEFKIWR